MGALPTAHLVVAKEKNLVVLSLFLLVFLTPGCSLSTGDIPVSGSAWLWDVSELQDSCWLLSDVVGAAVCPFEATDADVPRVGQWPSGYTYPAECILIHMLSHSLNLNSWLKSMPG